MKQFSFPLRLRYLFPLLALAVLLTLPAPPATAGKYVYEEEISLTLEILYPDTTITGLFSAGPADAAPAADTEEVPPPEPETTLPDEPTGEAPQPQPETTPTDEPADGEPQPQPEATPPDEATGEDPQPEPETTPPDTSAGEEDAAPSWEGDLP